MQRVYYNQTYNFGCASRLSLSLSVFIIQRTDDAAREQTSGSS